MKKTKLTLLLLLQVITSFSQESLNLRAEKLDIVKYANDSATVSTKKLGDSFFISINDTSVVLQNTNTTFNRNAKVEYKVTEVIFSYENEKLLRCVTPSNQELVIRYIDDLELYGGTWVFVFFESSDYNYKCSKFD